MTAQFAEVLNYRGERLSLHSNPLEDYFYQQGHRPDFEIFCSALWRGYTGHWEITDGNLYLTAIGANLADGTPASLQTVFPEASGRVFASWFSGNLRIPQGKRLRYVHQGYASTYERDLWIVVERGVVTGSRIEENVLDDEDEEEC